VSFFAITNGEGTHSTHLANQIIFLLCCNEVWNVNYVVGTRNTIFGQVVARHAHFFCWDASESKSDSLCLISTGSM
jgi:hypothetical protein